MTETVDIKTVERVRKLLNLARDGGATEAEASLAMERAQAIMLDNNLSMAMVEASGGQAVEARTKEAGERRANFRWQRELMAAIAVANFCHLTTVTKQRRIRGDILCDFAVGYEIIGRVSNVISARQMYEYLLQTCGRLREEYQSTHGKKEGALFVEGLADRLASRIQMRHWEKLQEQREEAEKRKREEARRAQHPSAAPGMELIVVLEDYAESERDLNNDMVQGWAPGTTKAKRDEQERVQAARNQRQADLIAQGVDPEVAWDMAHLDWTREKAEEYEARAKARAAANKDLPEPKLSSRYRGGGRTREDRLRDRLHTHSAIEGRRKADTVSLDPQIGKSEARRIK